MASGAEATKELGKFIREALLISRGDQANVVVKLASDDAHKRHLLGM